MQTILQAFIIFPEFVEVILLPLDEFQEKIDGEFPSQSDVSVCNKRSGGTRWSDLCLVFCFPAELLKKEKIQVDSKVYIFAMGMAQAFFKPRELPVLKQ